MRILSPAETGHSTNAFPSYVYCETPEGARGWVPQLILHREGHGVFGVISGLTRDKALNGVIVRVFGSRGDGRIVGETTNRHIAFPLTSVSILDFNEDVKHIQQKGRGSLKFAHPDKFGCRDSYSLLCMIIHANLNL